MSTYTYKSEKKSYSLYNFDFLFFIEKKNIYKYVYIINVTCVRKTNDFLEKWLAIIKQNLNKSGENLVELNIVYCLIYVIYLCQV